MELFLQNMQTAAQQVFILYIMVAVGFIADRLNVFTEKTARASNDLLFYIVNPCVIVNSFLNTPFTAESGKGFAIAMGCSAIAHLTGILFSIPLFNKKNKDNSAIFKYACVYGNVGYMVLPLANSILGSTGVFLCSGAVVVFNTLGFTHGIWLMNRGKDVKFELKSLILDYRNNGGGLLDAAVKVLSLFVPKGTMVVETRSRGGVSKKLYTQYEPLLRY